MENRKKFNRRTVLGGLLGTAAGVVGITANSRAIARAQVGSATGSLGPLSYTGSLQGNDQYLGTNKLPKQVVTDGTVPVDDYPGCTPWPFIHGVSSGDPLQDRVIIWTRITLEERDPDGAPGANPAGAEPEVAWTVSRNPEMTDVVASGTQKAVAAHDWTIKVDVTGLDAETTYYYQFSHDGKNSIIGRTRTATKPGSSEARLAVMSCTSYWSSYWTGLQLLADRNDVDLVIHLGDYLYDFIDGNEAVRSRVPFSHLTHPDNRDWKNLDEVRRRYALYRSDPKFVAAHQQHPWMIVWDNHDVDPNYGNELEVPEIPIEETVTLEDTCRAFWEWTPSRPVKADGSGEFLLVDDGSYPAPENVTLCYRSLDYGDLLSISAIDAQLGLPRYGRELDNSHLSHIKVGAPTLLGKTQFDWLSEALRGAENRGVLWKVIANQAWFSPMDTPDIVEGSTGATKAKFGLSRWSKYPEEKKAIVELLRLDVPNSVMVSGDAHGNLGSDILSASTPFNPYYPGPAGNNRRSGAQQGNRNAGAVRVATGNSARTNARKYSAGVEFAPSSMGRGGADDAIAGALPVGSATVVTATRAAEQALLNLNPSAQFMEWADHGYGIVHLTRESAIFEYWWQDKFNPRANDVLGHQMIAWAHDDRSSHPPRYKQQIDAITLHGLPVEPTRGTRQSAQAPAAETVRMNPQID